MIEKYMVASQMHFANVRLKIEVYLRQKFSMHVKNCKCYFSFINLPIFILTKNTSWNIFITMLEYLLITRRTEEIHFYHFFCN